MASIPGHRMHWALASTPGQTKITDLTPEVSVLRGNLSKPAPARSAPRAEGDVRSGTIIDMEFAAALVAVRTPLPLADIKIVRIEAS